MGGVAIHNKTNGPITALAFAHVPMPLPSRYFVLLETVTPGQYASSNAFLGQVHVIVWRHVPYEIAGVQANTILAAALVGLNLLKVGLRVAGAALVDIPDVAGVAADFALGPLVDFMVNWILERVGDGAVQYAAGTVADLIGALIRDAQQWMFQRGAPAAQIERAEETVKMTWGLVSSRTLNVTGGVNGPLTIEKPSVLDLFARTWWA
jgi:hypothetical protein